MSIGVKVSELLKEAFPDGASREELERVKRLVIASIDEFIIENTCFE